MDALEEVWKHLKFTEEEDDPIIIEEESDAWPTERHSHYLVGKLLTTKNSNSTAMKGTFTQAWQLEQGMAVRTMVNVSKPLFRRISPLIGEEKIWIDVQYERLPGFCYSCGRMGHQMKDCSDEAAKVKSKDRPLYGAWLHAWQSMNRMRYSKFERDRESAWLEKLNEHALTTPNSKVHACTNEKNKAQRSQSINQIVKGGALPNTRKVQIVNSKVHACIVVISPQPEVIPMAACGRPTKKAHNYGYFECATDGPMPKLGQFSEAHSIGVQKEVAQSNTSTAHALRAWAWGNGRSGGIGLWWSRVSSSPFSFSPRHILGDVFVVDVCFDVLRWISILLLDSGELDRDLPPRCFSESIDPSVDGCTSRQRSLKGGWAEALDATGKILSRWGKDDYLIFLVLYLYYDIYCNCNHPFFV